MARLWAILVFVGAAVSWGQSLDRVIAESKKLRDTPPPAASDKFLKDLDAARDRSRDLHAALRDWVETLLPKSRTDLDTGLPHAILAINAELRRSGLLEGARTQDEYSPGVVDRIDTVRPTQDPDKLALIIGVDVPCGIDDAAYIYDYSTGQRRRVLESGWGNGHPGTVSSVEFSRRDGSGDESMVVTRYGIQCGSNWNGLHIEIARLSHGAARATPLLSGEHGIYFGNDPAYQIRLTPSEFLIELEDRSIDAGILVRTHVLRYRLSDSGAQRIDPVALQPQDFVDEWLTRPWAEMELRSSASGLVKLKQWHKLLTGDYVGAGYIFVQLCSEVREDTQVGLALDWLHDEQLPEPIAVYFVVHASGSRQFEMKDISFERQKGCPGESNASSEMPTLFPKADRKK